MDIPIRTILFLLFFYGGGIVLQIYLSRMESRWFGLILPIMTFLWSLLTLSLVVFAPDVSLIHVIWQLTMVFLYVNISTAILLLVYAICRNGRKKKAKLDKMNVQDL